MNYTDHTVANDLFAVSLNNWQGDNARVYVGDGSSRPLPKQQLSQVIGEKLKLVQNAFSKLVKT